MKIKFDKKAYKPSDEKTRQQRQTFWNAKRDLEYKKKVEIFNSTV